MTSQSQGLPRLQVVYAWQRHLLGHRLLEPGEALSIGSSKRATFAAPDFPGGGRRFPFLKAISGGYRLKVSPGMTGWIESPGAGRREVSDVLDEPQPKRLFRNPHVREVDLRNGDTALVLLDEASKLRLQLTFVDPPEALGRPARRKEEPFLWRVSGVTSILVAAAVAVLMLFAPQEEDPKDEITQDRFAKLIEPVLAAPKMKQAVEAAKKEGEKKRQEKEAAMAKKMKDKEGKVGRPEAKGETVIPQGKRDVLRERVSKVGVLSILGNVKPGGSGLSKLLNDSGPNDMEQAVTGLAGARLAVGAGSGGLGNAGTGLGGGGTGFGRLQGSGNLNVGAGRGVGRRGAGLGTGKERAVSAGVSTGDADSSGGLTRDQIMRVVQSHMAALKYCYEKELQRKPNLSGKIELRWMIRPEGDVDRVGVATTSMRDAGVESCMQRQVKNWRFPKATQPTLVKAFPFLFRGTT